MKTLIGRRDVAARLRQKRREVSVQRFLSVLLVLAIIALIPVTGFFVLARRENNTSADVTDGRKVLKKLSTASVDEVQAILTEREELAKSALAQKERDEAVEETIRKIQSGKLTYRKVLSDLYIAGDSLMDGLRAYNILDANHLVTEVSAMLGHLEKNFDKIVDMHPPILMLHYGLNGGPGDTVRGNFISKYKKIIERFKEELPNTRIVISLIFPVKSTKQGMEYIKEYNRDLKKMCVDEGIEYLDSSPVFKGHDEFYAGDGEHLQPKVYSENWLPYVIRALEITA